jgi:hypothetical protein
MAAPDQPMSIDFDESEWLMIGAPLVEFLTGSNIRLEQAEWIRREFKHRVREAIMCCLGQDVAAIEAQVGQVGEIPMLRQLLWQLLITVMHLSKSEFGDFCFTSIEQKTKPGREIFRAIPGGKGTL